MTVPFKIMNTHNHIMTVDIQPPELGFSDHEIPKSIILALTDALQYGKPLLNITEKLSKFFRNGNKLYIKEFLKAYTTNLYEGTDIMIKHLNKAGIDFATPLMLDLAPACDSKYYMLPYRDQLDWFSKLPLYSEGKLFPFIMFDPRRKNVMEITAEELENGGFLGVKMYPPLGYSPNYNDTFVNTPEMNDNLKQLYAYCEKHQIPITTHCSKGGIRGIDVNEKLGSSLADPKLWYDVLWDYNIRLNLAHFGSNRQFYETFYEGNNNNWTATIVTYLKEFCEDGSQLYTDISFHEYIAYENMQKNYFHAFRKAYEDPFVASRLMYGDDWPISAIDYTPKEYLSSLRANLGDSILEVIANQNVKDFLMNDSGQLPQRVVNYLQKNNVDVPVF